MNTTQAQHKALDDALVVHADHLKFRKYNMRLHTDIKLKEATFQVVLDALALTPFYQAFLITIEICLKIPRQEFEDLPLENEFLSFIKDLGHSGDIIYITDVSVDYLHQPWRAFSTIINKCLSGKEIGMDKIRLSKDQSIFRRNEMFWHTARDDTMFTSIRYISRHEKTQVYYAILPKELRNQEMLKSKAYKTYYAFASGEKTPKPKYVRKKADSDTSPKQKPVQDTKGTRLKTKAKMAKSDKKKQHAKKPKAKGLSVLSEIALTDSNVPNEQHLETIGTDEGTDEDEDDVNDSDDISDEGKDDNDCNNGISDDHDDDSNEERMKSNRDVILGPNLTNVDQTEHEEEDDEVTKELYDDVNVNLGNEDTKMTDADQAENEIASLMDTSTHHTRTIPKITSSFTTPTPPPPKFFNPLSQQATPTPTLMASETIALLPALPDFAFVFKFNERVTNLEEVINKAIQAHNFDCRKEAQVEKREYIELVDSTVRIIIKEEVNAQLPQILPQAILDVATLIIEKNVNKSLEATILTRSKAKNSLGTSKDASQSQHQSFGKSIHVKEPSHTVKDLCMQQDQEFVTGDNDEQPADKEVPKHQSFYGYASNMTSSIDVYSRRRIIAVTKLNIMKKYDYGHLEEIEVRRDDQKLYTFEEGDFKRLRIQDIKDMLILLVQQKLINLTINEGKWSNLDKKKARVMVQDIDKQLYQSRLMWNLKKFIGAREYGNDLRLLERTI
nr:hypothetical protein [Tanacetum cinerariifolium]